MNFFEAIVYGVIQGLSEFLPISSSGHLALLPYVMNIQDPGVIFDLMMHLGTALAVITYFRKEIFKYAKTFTPGLASFSKGTPDQWFVRNFILTTFSSILMIVALMPISKLARSPMIIIFNLTFFGIMLWLADRHNRKMSSHLNSPFEHQMQWKMAILLGIAQAVAIFPGVSRSGITLSMAMLLGMKRKEAGSYSFLMSLPIIIAGILKEVPDIMQGTTDSLLILLTGILTSFVVGWLTIHYFMKLIAQIHLVWFTVYRWIIAVIMVVLLF